MTIQIRKASRFIDLSGSKFAKLSVKSFVGKRRWLCVCDCGNEVCVSGKKLKSGNNKSCGCLKITKLMERSAKHSMCRTSEYDAWISIKKRCNNPLNKDYKYYGGRGITLCEKWDASFQDFIRDMGMKPSPQHSIDRIDNNGNYEPSNCRWATRSEQCRNQRNNRMVVIDGCSIPLVAAAEKHNIKYKVVSDRLKSGWSLLDALNKPIKGQGAVL